MCKVKRECVKCGTKYFENSGCIKKVHNNYVCWLCCNKSILGI